jgi:hypothetical protein
MIRLKDLLREAGELAAYPFNYDSSYGHGYFTTADGTRYEVRARAGADREMEISFGVYGDAGIGGNVDREITTNAGDQYRIMSTVIAIVKRAVAEFKPHLIFFGASNNDPRRIALYMRYIAPILRDYEISKQGVNFVELTRKGILKRITQFDWTGIKDKP